MPLVRDQSARLQIEMAVSPVSRRWAAEADLVAWGSQVEVSTPPAPSMSLTHRDRVFEVTERCGRTRPTNNEVWSDRRAATCR